MRVLELELDNFARVFTGLGKTNLLLDLRTLKNRIKLFVGANGTGKTSIMGCIHPYAFNNHTSDNRDNSDLIIPDMSGKKRILIQDGNDLFEIIHIYKRDSKGSISVKSYISQNMKELNENGNVGSFKAIVEEKLGITEQYLILLSLGNSIDGFIDMSTSDRKNFIIKLFDELGIYSELYKKKSSDVRALKSILSNITYKLDKFKTMNVDDLERSIIQLEKQINLLEQDLKFNMVEMGKIRSNITTYSDVIADYDTKQQHLSNLLTDLDIAKRKLNGVDVLEPSILENNIGILHSEITKLEINKQALINNIQSKLDIIDGINNSLSQDRTNLSKLETNESTSELLSLITKLQIELDNLSNIDTESISGYNKADMIVANVYLDELRSMMTDLVLFNDDDLVNKMVHSVMQTPGIDAKVNSLLNKATGNLINYNMLVGSNVSIKDIKPIKDTGFECGSEHFPTCPYVQFNQMYMEIINNRELDKKDKLDSMKMEISQLEKTRDIVFTIKKLLNFVDSNISKFNLPIEIFDPSKFIYQYMDDRTIYNETLMIEMIDTLELIDKRDSIEDKLSVYRQKYDNIMSNKDIFDNLTNSVLENTEKLKLHMNEKDNFALELSKVTFELDEKKLDLDKLESDLVILNNVSSIRKQIADISQEIRNMSDVIEKITDLREQLQNTERYERELDQQIKEARHNKQQIESTIAEMRNLSQEYADIQYKYDIMLEIRDSLSPTKGIPLHFIEDYIKDMASDVNELLYVVYRGRIKLIPEEINVDDREFNIPYMSKGTRISDISNASDGERAIIALAFSLVLSKMSINGYNIMLLDELDTALDVESRGKFIQILETYLDIIGAEDVYIVSHNNMFDSYDVSVIMTSDGNVFNIDEENKLRIY